MLAWCVSLDYMNGDCNCNQADKVRNGTCIFGGKCRKYCAVYQVKCLLCGCSDIGSTGRHIKDRVNEKLSIAKQWANGNKVNKKGAALGRHLCHHLGTLHPAGTVTGVHVRSLVEAKPLWVGNMISVMKTFKTRSCRLCNEERVRIVKNLDKNPGKVINDRVGLMEACQHAPKFHRFLKQ